MSWGLVGNEQNNLSGCFLFTFVSLANCFCCFVVVVLCVCVCVCVCVSVLEIEKMAVEILIKRYRIRFSFHITSQANFEICGKTDHRLMSVHNTLPRTCDEQWLPHKAPSFSNQLPDDAACFLTLFLNPKASPWFGCFRKKVQTVKLQGGQW